MTIFPYQIDNIIKAYNKQNKARYGAEVSLSGSLSAGQSDLVTLHNTVEENDAYLKISYTLLDLLKK